jgi:hypothetical protein
LAHAEVPLMPAIPEHIRRDLNHQACSRMFEPRPGQLILPLASLTTVKPGTRTRRMILPC